MAGTYKLLGVTRVNGSRIRRAEVSPPLKGHTVVHEVRWFACGGKLATEVFANPDDSRCLVPASLEDAGYVRS